MSSTYWRQLSPNRLMISPLLPEEIYLEEWFFSCAGALSSNRFYVRVTHHLVMGVEIFLNFEQITITFCILEGETSVCFYYSELFCFVFTNPTTSQFYQGTLKPGIIKECEEKQTNPSNSAHRTSSEYSILWESF